MEKYNDLKQHWLDEEKIAHIKGWDFSHLNGRYEEENDLPWDYFSIIKEHLNDDMKILDIDTGGGEFILSLGHPYTNISATEGYKPNVELCKEVLLPLGIDFKEATSLKELPFENESFDIVLNRHGDYNVDELYRVLKPGGLFITQQVGAENDFDLVKMLLPDSKMQFPNQYLDIAKDDLVNAGFEVLQAQEAFCKIKFYDVGALVWFARIIEWEFIDFSVESCFENLCKAQDIIDEKGVIEGTTHRFMLVVKKA